jgi:hypothetical protein
MQTYPKLNFSNVCRNSLSSVGSEVDSFLEHSSPSSHSGWFITKQRSSFVPVNKSTIYENFYFICTKIKLIMISEKIQQKKIQNKLYATGVVR